VAQDPSHGRQGGRRHDVHRIWFDCRPGVCGCDRGVDGGGRFAEYDVPVGVERVDDGGRWLNGINSDYPRMPPLDLRSSLRASLPGGG